jgi:protein-S-isoprenylcysteine O-methyltransferase Ste14
VESVFIELALGLVCAAALGRMIGILTLKLRQARYAKRALAVPRGWRDLCTVPEPYLLGVTTVLLWVGRRIPAEPATPQLLRVAAALALAVLAIVLMLWVLRVFPSVSTGHYVLPEQRVVSEGPYAWVRHPLYLAAYLVWLAVALGFGSVIALALAVLYVIPSYWIYLRSEEAMLVEHLGPTYADYCERVGALLPRRRRAVRPGGGSP